MAFVAPDHADAALAALRSRPEGAAAVCIGRAVEGLAGQVVMRTWMGARRVIEMPRGEQLPRIC